MNYGSNEKRRDFCAGKYQTKMKTIITLIGMALLLCGCASVGHNFDSRKVAEIKVGETTEADLINMFGPASHRGMESTGTISMGWVYTQATTKASTFVPFAGPFIGGVDAKTKFLTVILAAGGKVSSYRYDGGGMDTKGYIPSDPETATNKTNAVKVLKSPKAQ